MPEDQTLDKTPENPDCAVCNAQFNAAKDNKDNQTVLEKRNCCGFYGNVVDNKEKFFHFQSFPFLSSLWVHVENAKISVAEFQFKTKDASHQKYIDEYHAMLTTFKLLQSESTHEKSLYLEWGSTYLLGDEEHIFVRTKDGKLKKTTKAEFDKGKKPTRKMSLKEMKLQRQNSYSKERERKTRKKTQTSMVCSTKGCSTLINAGTYVKRQSTAESLKARLEGKKKKDVLKELQALVESARNLGDQQGEETALSELELLDSIEDGKKISTELEKLVKKDQERESFTYVKGHGCIIKAELGKEQRDAYEFVETDTGIMGGKWQMTVIDESGSEETVELPKKCIDCQCCNIETELLNPLLRLTFENAEYNIALHALADPGQDHPLRRDASIDAEFLKVSSLNKHVHEIVNQIRDVHLMKNLRSATEAAAEFMQLMEECGSNEISKKLEICKYADKTLLNSNWLEESKEDGLQKEKAKLGLKQLQLYVDEHIEFIGEAVSDARKKKFDIWVAQGDDALTSRAFLNMKLGDARMRVNIRRYNSKIEKIDVFEDKWKNRLQLLCSFCALFGIKFEIGSSFPVRRSSSLKSFDAESLGEDDTRNVLNAIAKLGEKEEERKLWNKKEKDEKGSWGKFKFHVFHQDPKEKRTLESKFFLRVKELIDQMHNIPVDKKKIAGMPYNSIADEDRVKKTFRHLSIRRIAAIEVINTESRNGVLSGRGLRVYFEFQRREVPKGPDAKLQMFRTLGLTEDSIVCFEDVVGRNMRIMKPDGTFDAFNTNAEYSKLVYIGTRSENRGYFKVPKTQTLQSGVVRQSKTTGQVSGQDAIVGDAQKLTVKTNKEAEVKIDCRVLEFELVDESARIEWEPINEKDEIDISKFIFINRTPFKSTPITRDMINVSKSLLPEIEHLKDEEHTAKEEEERNIETANETDSSLEENEFIILHRWLSAYIYKLFGEIRKAGRDEFLMYQQHR
eukprot:Stramenopile-MAST_4_protein_4248